MYLAEEYLQYYEKYTAQYNSNVLVLMQVGSFYEAYATLDRGPNLSNISQLLSIAKTKKNKDNTKTNVQNPIMLGFPIIALVKFLDILIANNYIVVVIDQVGKKTDNKETRKVTNIYSKGTYIENLEKKDGNYITTVYVSKNSQKNGDSLYAVGLTAVDVSTGNVIIHEAYSNKYDQTFALDETDRFLSSLSSKEVLIYSDTDKDYLVNYLKLDDSYRYYDKLDSKYFKLNFQNETLSKVYKNSKSLISPIEQLDLTKNIYAIISLITAFDFVHDKNPNLLNNLQKPIRYMSNKHLLLGNNAIRQLDIINTDTDIKCKYRSLFHVINCTSTALGERFLKMRLLSPLINANELNSIYDMTEILLKDDLYLKVETHLNNIRDIERLQRKMELQLMKPFELPMLMSSYENILDIIKLTKKKLPKLIPEKLDDIQKFIYRVNRIFNVKELEKYSNFQIETSIFNKNIHEDVDKLKNSVNSAVDFIEKVRIELNNLLLPSKQKIYVKRNDREGYYLFMTNKVCELLKSRLITVTVDGIKIKPESFEFKELGKSTKIFLESIHTDSKTLAKYKEQFEMLNKKYFFQELVKIHNKYQILFDQCNKFIANIDFLKSSAKVAKLYNYVRPKIVNGSSHVIAKKLRHPIIERLIDYEYVPHDVELGTKLKGILLYGINASGKSSIMKAIGLAVILSQSGLFVPAHEFEISPYHSLYTRITGDDDIFRGLSSFALEMTEINAILRRADSHTLVIGDEVCRGTEHISGNALVASTIIKLSECESSFIFASHLHEIMELDKIKKLKNIKAYHLSVKYDKKSNKLIYDRQLSEGVGEHVYGITVAQYIIQDPEFIDMALEIKNELLESSKSIISGKTSKYNKNIYVNECHLCGKTKKLETHHINFQKDCENGFVKGKTYIKKNQESNLIVLCDKCHDEIHNKKIKLVGYVMTSNGKEII